MAHLVRDWPLLAARLSTDAAATGRPSPGAANVPVPENDRAMGGNPTSPIRRGPIVPNGAVLGGWMHTGGSGGPSPSPTDAGSNGTRLTAKYSAFFTSGSSQVGKFFRAGI